MSQRTCPACGTANSEASTVCTACGKVIAGPGAPRKRPVWLWWVIALIAVLMAAPYVARIIQGVDDAQSPDPPAVGVQALPAG